VKISVYFLFENSDKSLIPIISDKYPLDNIEFFLRTSKPHLHNRDNET